MKRLREPATRHGQRAGRADVSAADSSRCRPGEVLELIAGDGYRLAATLYEPPGPVRGHLVVANAIGVSQRHYRRFAIHAASAGWRTLTFDYRGIGQSRPADLRQLRLDYFDWGRLDLAAALTRMSDPDRALFVVGHSYAGHAFGVVPAPWRVDGLVTFGTGAGWHGWMPRLEQLKVLALWHGLGPVITRTSGYLRWSLLGMGEDLPLGFYRQLKHWCRHPRHFLDDDSMQHVAGAFARVRVPILAANAVDDRWSPPRSRDAIMTAYRNVRVQTLDLVPREHGMNDIGHMGYFRGDATRLWDLALNWFEGITPLPATRACRSWSSEPITSTSANWPGTSPGLGCTMTRPSISGASAAERASMQG